MGRLSSISQVITIPGNIDQSGSHACFGFRALEEAFKPLEETFELVIQLCGTRDLPCPIWSPPSSPLGPTSRASPSLPVKRLHPKPEADSVITLADYLASDEEFNNLLSQLRQEAEDSGQNASGSTVM